MYVVELSAVGGGGRGVCTCMWLSYLLWGGGVKYTYPPHPTPPPPPLLFSPSDSPPSHPSTPVSLPLRLLTLLLETISEWALKSLVHKITNVPVFYMELQVWIWMGGKSITRAV
jgi:hypothetical protein